jgi:hypothetical protein
MGKGGRFGKYGDTKRFERLRQKQLRPLKIEKYLLKKTISKS